MLSLEQAQQLLGFSVAVQMIIHSLEHFRLDIKDHALTTKSGLAENLVLLFIASLTFWTPNIWIWLGLFFYRLRHLLRFGGLFAGGSEVLVQYSFVAILLQQAAAPELWQRASVFLLGALVLFSYAAAGWNKLVSSSWRNGSALSSFFQVRLVSNFKFLNELSPLKYKALSYGIIFFELASLSILLWPEYSIWYLILAASFHGLNFWIFGLNRFFWAWVGAYPAVIYIAGQLMN